MHGTRHVRLARPLGTSEMTLTTILTSPGNWFCMLRSLAVVNLSNHRKGCARKGFSRLRQRSHSHSHSLSQQRKASPQTIRIRSRLRKLQTHERALPQRQACGARTPERTISRRASRFHTPCVSHSHDSRDSRSPPPAPLDISYHTMIVVTRARHSACDLYSM